MPYSDPDKQREYQRKWMAERRQTWIKENGPCTDCGTLEQLEVDHADAAAKVTHRVWSWTASRREAELAKCVVRCQLCHHKKTLQSAEHPRGTANGMAKLAEQQIHEIRTSTLPGRQLARLYGVDEKNIRSIRLRTLWAHLE